MPEQATVNYIVFDLEATCWENRPQDVPQEIIEIGAYRINGMAEVEAPFQAFVRPLRYPHLSYFCQQLTGIAQRDIDRADDFGTVCEDFLEFIGYYDDEDFLLCSWGNFDKRQLRKDCLLHGIDPDWTDRHINLKEQFARIRNLSKPCNLERSVTLSGYEWEGRLHRGIDDARNLTRVFLAHFDDWHHF